MKKLSELNLEDDFLFAKVMSSPEICKEFLEKLLEVKIEKVEIPENQRVIDLLIESKGIRLDIYLKDKEDTVYNIEMQRSSNRNIPKRLRYYQGNIDLDLITAGTDYKELSKSYIIFICTFDLFKKGRHKYTFDLVCREDNTIKLNDEANRIILNTNGVIKDIDEELIEFLKYVRSSNDNFIETSKGTLVKNVHRKVVEVKNDKRVEVEFMTLLERDREKIEEGIEIGREEGREEGLEKGKLEIAKNMKEAGADIEFISKMTGLSKDKIEKL